MSDRIGIFGGSFDPVHLGHLLLAETFREELRLDRVIFVPAARSPLKSTGPIASNRARLEMLELATGGHDAFTISTVELDRGGISYTVETLEAFATEFPSARLYLLLGADTVKDFASWRAPERIGQLAVPILGPRGKTEPDLSALAPFVPEANMAETAAQMLSGPHVQISSTDLRHRVAAGRSIRYRVTKPVEAYIETQLLYRSVSPDS